MKDIEFWIDGTYYREKEENVTVFQKSFEKKIDIPCFCYHENLSIAGNCRMCLVELNTSLKLVASCAMPIANGMQIETKSLRVKKARESIIEFLLVNHPLDCPICDQGGECDLQEITSVYGSDRGRYYEYAKRAVIDKHGGPFVKMIMTRCIHCTRCIRFLNEISGVPALGMINRGNSSEISTYVLNNLVDEMSGNIIDLCPVGALTSIPYAFTARPWELNFVESIDVLDSICSNVRIDYLNNKIYRVLPVYNKTLNEDWITNRVRFFYDSNNIQRIRNPMMRLESGNFITISWLKVAYLFFSNLNKHLDEDSSVLSFSGMLADLDSVTHIKSFFNSFGVNSFYADFIDVNADFRSNYLMNSMLINLENNTHFVFFCLNTRLESPILNSRLRKLSLLNENIKFYGFGINSSYLNLPMSLYGNSVKKLIDILNFKSELCRDLLFKGYNYSIFNLNDIKREGYMFFFGLSFFQFYNGSYLFDVFKRWISINFVLNYAVVFPFVGYLSYFEINGSNNNFLTNKKNFIYLNNVDDKNFLKTFSKSKNYVVYHGSFFSDGAENADLLIPLHSVFENNYKYINIEGRIRKSLTVLNYNNNNITAEEFFKFLIIIRKTYLSHNYSNVNNLNQVVDYFKFVEPSIPFVRNESLFQEVICDIFLYKREHLLTEDWIYNSTIQNFYNVDVYSKMSPVLCSAAYDYMIKLNVFI